MAKLYFGLSKQGLVVTAMTFVVLVPVMVLWTSDLTLQSPSPQALAPNIALRTQYSLHLGIQHPVADQDCLFRAYLAYAFGNPFPQTSACKGKGPFRHSIDVLKALKRGDVQQAQLILNHWKELHQSGLGYWLQALVFQKDGHLNEALQAYRLAFDHFDYPTWCVLDLALWSLESKHPKVLQLFQYLVSKSHQDHDFIKLALNLNSLPPPLEWTKVNAKTFWASWPPEEDIQPPISQWSLKEQGWWYTSKAFQYFQWGDWTKLQALFALKPMADLPLDWFMIQGWAYVKDQQYDRALWIWKQVLNPNDLSLHTREWRELASTILFEAAQSELLIELWEGVPSSQMSARDLYVLAYAYFSVQDLDALKHLAQSVDLSAQSPWISALLRLLWIAQGKPPLDQPPFKRLKQGRDCFASLVQWERLWPQKTFEQNLQEIDHIRTTYPHCLEAQFESIFWKSMVHQGLDEIQNLEEPSLFGAHSPLPGMRWRSTLILGLAKARLGTLDQNTAKTLLNYHCSDLKLQLMQAEIAWRMKRQSKVLKNLQIFGSDGPLGAYALALKALIMAPSDPEQALELLPKTLKVLPWFIDAKFVLARIYQDKDDYKKAKAILVPMLDDSLLKYQSLDALGTLFLKTQHYLTGRYFLDNLYKKTSDSPDNALFKAQMALWILKTFRQVNAKNKDDVFFYLKKSKESFKTHPEWNYWMGQYQEVIGRKRVAIDYYQKAGNFKPALRRLRQLKPKP